MCFGFCGSEKEEREREGDGVTQQMYERSSSFSVSLGSSCHLSIRSLFATYCRAQFLKVNNNENKNEPTNGQLDTNSVNNVLDALKRHDVKAIRSFGTNQNYHCSKSVRMRPTIDKTNQKRGEKA